MGFGAKDVLEQSCKNLYRKIDVCYKELMSATKDVTLELQSYPHSTSGFGMRHHLSSIYQVYLDGVLQQLPELEGLVVLNINSWSAGCCVWNDRSTSDHFGASRWEMERENGDEGEWEMRREMVMRESGRWGGRWGDEEGEWEMGREIGRWGGRVGDGEGDGEMRRESGKWGGRMVIRRESGR